MDNDRKIVELNMDDILPNRFQPRITFGEDAINELAESIKEHGVIQPIVVRKINDKYEIIAGERRFKASSIAGKTTIPAIITDLNDKQSAEIALIENVQREDLTPIEEAVSYKKILDMGYLTQEELSSKLGKKQSTISNKLRLLNLDDEVQEALLEKKISERHARSLLKLKEKDQREMLNKIISERLTVRKTDEEINKLLNGNNNIESSEEPIELLEIEDNPKEEKEGEKNMNSNEMNQNYNIPTDPIIEENQAPGIMPNNMGTQSVVSNQPLPGFMNVEQIANNAVDINSANNTSNFDALLNTNNTSVSSNTGDVFNFNPQVNTSSPQTNSQISQNNNTNEFSQINGESHGKFFDLGNFGLDTNESSQESNNFVSDIDAKQANVDFSIPTPSTVSPVMPGMSQVPTPEPAAPVMPEIPQVPTPEPVSPVMPEMPQVPASGPVSPVMPEIPQVPTSGPVSPVMPEIPQVPTPEPAAPVMPGMSQVPTPEPVAPVMPEMSQVPTPEPAAPVMPEMSQVPASEPVVNSTVTPAYTVPTAEEVDKFLNNLDTTDNNSQNIQNVESVIQPEPVNNNISNDNKINQAISIIQDAKDKIASLGFSVDLDEFNFDDMYQAIFKIDK